MAETVPDGASHELSDGAPMPFGRCSHGLFLAGLGALLLCSDADADLLLELEVRTR